MISDDVKKIYYFSANAEGSVGSDMRTPLYAAAYVLSDRLMNDSVEKLFYVLGDNYYYKMLVNAYGKQKLNLFKNEIKECVSDVSKRYVEGEAEIVKVPDDAYCLMDLIADLGSIDGCVFYPNHEDFNYNRIGAKRVARGSNLTDANKALLAGAKNIEEAVARLTELKENNIDTKFVETYPNRGYSLTDLVWNESRANLSVRVRIEGEVELPKNKFDIDNVMSFKYRTFTLIKDGIVNVSQLPVNYDFEIEKLLIQNKVKFDVDMGNNAFIPNAIVIDLSSLPIINKKMVKSVSAMDLAKQEWELIKLQAEKKVFDYYKNMLYPKTSKSFADMLGQEAADWLKVVGITDFNGYAPLTDTAEKTDHYMSVNLLTKIKGLSSLPKVLDVINKMSDAKKPLKIGEVLMAQFITEFLAKQAEINSSESIPANAMEQFLTDRSIQSNKNKRAIMQEIAKTKFAIILSKKWFIEFKDFDDNKLSLSIDGIDLDFTFDLTEKQVEI